MTTVRKLNRKNWTRQEVAWKESFEDRNKRGTHATLVHWIKGHCSGEVKWTIWHSYRSNPVTKFAFANESDAAMFVLRWK